MYEFKIVINFVIIIEFKGSRYRVLADYTALSNSELTMKEGDFVSLLKVGCAGWWYVRAFGNDIFIYYFPYYFILLFQIKLDSHIAYQ